MTEMRDFDRLTRAWLDLMPDEAPDRVIDAVLQAVESTRQQPGRRRWALWRLPQMNRFSLVAGVVVLAAILAGGSVLLSNFKALGPGGPAATPAITPAPSETPLVSGQGQGVGYRTTVLPELATADRWIADATPNAALGQTEPRMELATSPGAERISVIVNGASLKLSSQAVTAPPEMFGVVGLGGISGCNVGDFGLYQVRFSDDGLTVTLIAAKDACALRSATLARTWTRSFGANNHGSRGVVAAFQPMLEVTLPDAGFDGDVGNDAATAFSQALDRTLIAVKNPTGWTDPCSATGGGKQALPTTAAGFSAYIGKIPGFTVQSSDLTIDGRAALHLTVPTKPTPGCSPANGHVIEWSTDNPADSGSWHISQGDTDEIYLVNVGNDVYLLQWLGAGVTHAEEQQVLSTVHFISELPTAP
jgi:hypothetical protein